MKLAGLPVFDAKEPLLFTVTKRDVKLGGVQAPDSCAMALACKREHHSKDVRIHLNYSYVLEKDHWVRYRTPACVTQRLWRSTAAAPSIQGTTCFWSRTSPIGFWSEHPAFANA